MNELELRQLFKNLSDCYSVSFSGIGTDKLLGTVIQTMTEDRFIEALKQAKLLLIMNVDIYRVVDKSGSSFLHEEICRNCAEKFHNEGHEIEYDGHLSKYILIKEDVSYYEDGSDEENEEISCSLCGEYLVSKLEPLEYAI